jgi:hypothetical protein
VCMLSEVARPKSDGTFDVSEGQVPPGPNNHWLYFDKQASFARSQNSILERI